MPNHMTANSNGTELMIIQVNLARAFKANQLQSSFQSDERFDISAIQELYILVNKIIGFPIKHRIIAYKENPKAAIIIHNDTLSIFPIAIEQNIVVATVSRGDIATLLINCYCPPKEPLSPILNTIGKMLQEYSHLDAIIVGDFNSKNQL